MYEHVTLARTRTSRIWLTGFPTLGDLGSLGSNMTRCQGRPSGPRPAGRSRHNSPSSWRKGRLTLLRSAEKRLPRCFEFELLGCWKVQKPKKRGNAWSKLRFHGDLLQSSPLGCVHGSLESSIVHHIGKKLKTGILPAGGFGTKLL